MTRDTVFNFAAGPSTMPLSVLEQARAELLDYKGSGTSVMEMSHRGKLFGEIIEETKALMRELMSIPDSHEILLLQGGATTQFAAIPMNLMSGGCADYAISGNFSKKAAKEAEKYGRVNIAYNSFKCGNDRIPAQGELRLSEGASYFYYCANNTAFGSEWQYVPKAHSPLVCDMSSDILSCPVDVSGYGLIYAGGQKNMSPAGLTVVIMDKSLAGHELPYTPEILSYRTMIENGSMLNTPPCWCIYMMGLMLGWVKAQGGLAAMDSRRRERAGLLYDFIDGSDFYTAKVQPGSRSYMNVCFTAGDEETDKLFAREAEQKGLLCLKGHKAAGGLRASLYNAMPIEGVEALIEFMKEFEIKTHV